MFFKVKLQSETLVNPILVLNIYFKKLKWANISKGFHLRLQKRQTSDLQYLLWKQFLMIPPFWTAIIITIFEILLYQPILHHSSHSNKALTRTNWISSKVIWQVAQSIHQKIHALLFNMGIKSFKTLSALSTTVSEAQPQLFNCVSRVNYRMTKLQNSAFCAAAAKLMLNETIIK